MSYVLHEEFSCDFTGGPMNPQGFAIHWWGDPSQRPQFWNIVNVLLERSRQRSASVNFVVEQGIVACLVDPFTVAWAQGDGTNGWGNLNLISIECNPRCSPGDRETVAELMADQHITNGVPLVAYPHKKFTATQCPGVWEQHIPWLLERAKQIVAEKTGRATPTTTPAPTTEQDEEMKPIITLMADGSGKLYATVDFITKWHLPEPNWVQHYLNIEKAGWITIRRSGTGPEAHIQRVPAFGTENAK